MPGNSDFVVLGKIVGAYGVQGWVRVHAFADDPQAWSRLSSWWLGLENSPPEHWREVALTSSRLHSDSLVVQLEGVSDRNGAEALKGTFVGVPRAAMPAAKDNEYYWADLIGLDVVSAREHPLGKVEKLIETGANDVLCVRSDDGKEHLLPFVAAVILDVDLAAKRIRVEWEADW
ncbi:MAG: ribosome maturation factor RimM [Betaproteobacteria bacterium]|uniref:Ribosome maturation factor RimM n=1 Tax=Candidatus Proximibacter danicus TaxID=2954365 RepID=A0A9D7K1K8_9PROT|nr:ribosome maturation factor RimM [Candidatus Proximibacter danicus]